MNSILLLYMPNARQRMLPFAPLGIGVLAGYLRRRGVAVHVDDLEMRTWDKDIVAPGFLKKIVRRFPLQYNNTKKVFLNRLKVDRYLEESSRAPEIQKIMQEWESLIIDVLPKVDFVGFSVMGFHQLTTSLCFAKYIKEKYKIKIIMGGSFFSSRMGVLLEKLPFLDYLVCGEGERPLFELLSGDCVRNIQSLIYRENGKSVTNRAKNKYVDDLSPDYEGLPFSLYRQYSIMPLGFELSKGCRNKCSFCVTRKKPLFFKPIDQAVEELRRTRERYKTDYFMFVDNAINIDKRYSIEFCEKLVNEKNEIVWSAYYIPDDDDPAFLKLLKRAGCVQLRYGIETFGADALHKMNKSINYKTVCDLLKHAHEAGLWNHLVFMLGHPGEKLRDILHLGYFIVRYRKFFRSAVVAYFVLGKVDMFNEPCNDSAPSYEDRKTREHDFWGVRYRKYHVAFLQFKSYFLYAVLRLSGIKIRDNFNKSKTDIETKQFLYSAFSEIERQKNIPPQRC